MPRHDVDTVTELRWIQRRDEPVILELRAAGPHRRAVVASQLEADDLRQRFGRFDRDSRRGCRQPLTLRVTGVDEERVAAGADRRAHQEARREQHRTGGRHGTTLQDRAAATGRRRLAHRL